MDIESVLVLAEQLEGLIWCQYTLEYSTVVEQPR
jgi:hypothetical protein